MANISVEHLKPGMVLEAEVKDINGRLLLNAGVEITSKHIYIFKTWGVTEVEIKGAAEEDTASGAGESMDPGILKRAEDELNGIFLHTDRTHPFIREIFRICAARKARQLSGGSA